MLYCTMRPNQAATVLSAAAHSLAPHDYSVMCIQYMYMYCRFSCLSVGFSLIALNGQPVANRCLPDGTTAMTMLNNPDNYPVSLKFARLRVSINERIMLLSMFHSYVWYTHRRCIYTYNVIIPTVHGAL